MTTHLSPQYRAQFSPESFAEESLSFWIVLELTGLPVNTSACTVSFSASVPLHMRYRARLLQSPSPSPSPSSSGSDSRGGGGGARLVDDDDGDDGGEGEEALVRAMLWGDARASGGQSDHGKETMRRYGEAEEGRQHLASILPAPIVALTPSRGGGSLVTSRVVTSRLCLECATSEHDQPRELRDSCRALEQGDKCMPHLVLFMSVGLQSHVHVVLWSTALVLLLTTYGLSWLLLHPKKRGLPSEAQGVHPSSD